MLITPRPGIDETRLLDSLRSVHRSATILRGAGGPAEAHKRLLAYLDWANVAVQMLAMLISDADLHVLVLTKRYEQLLSGVGIMWGTGREFQRAVIDLVDLEVNQRVEALESAIKELEAHKERWANVGDLLVLDTNFYVEHPDEVQDADLARVTANTAPGWGIHVLVPLLVVDELDRLKRDNRARSRARTALKTLNQVFANVSADRPMGRLRHAYDTTQPDGNLGLGPVTMELLFDPLDHERLPDNDAEIVDRALAVQAIAGQPVTMVTYDTSMSFRARQVGLKDLLLTLP